MKHTSTRTISAALALFSLFTCATGALAQAKMQIEAATTAAIAAMGGATTAWFGKGDQRVENGVEVWRFIVTKNMTSIYQVRVNAITGAKIKVDFVGPANGAGPTITMNQAAQTARASKPGFVWKVESALFNSTLEWAVYIAGNDGRQYEVRVNMTTGAIRRTELRGGGSGSGRGGGR